MPLDGQTYHRAPPTVLDRRLHKLRQLRQLLGDPKRWTQGTRARWVNRPTEPQAREATSFCLIGAADRLDCSASVVPILEVELGTCNYFGVMSWNDNMWRKHADVIGLIDRAIARTERELADHAA